VVARSRSALGVIATLAALAVFAPNVLRSVLHDVDPKHDSDDTLLLRFELMIANACLNATHLSQQSAKKTP
jgi:hypothetical protein